MAVEVRREVPQLHRNAVVRFVPSVRHSAVINACRCCSLVLFRVEMLAASKEFIRREHPIYRDGVATVRGTAKPQRTVTPSTACHLDLVASNNFAANQTVTFVV